MRDRRTALLLSLGSLLAATQARAADPDAPLPKVAQGWKIELVKQAPEVVFPTAIVSDEDGTLYLGQDPMDMPGPPTRPIDSVLKIPRQGNATVFADRLWAVMGLEWADDTLYVVHAPFLSAFRDTDGDGKADRRDDLITGLGPKVPGFSGINDHVASGVRLGMDGFLYISVGDKGIPRGVGKDGTVIQLFGGGVIRIRPDGTGLEVVSTGERNPLSVALTALDEVFTYGNDDDSKKWPNSLTHHIVGGHYGYPYQFLTAPSRALPVTAGEMGGSGAQALCYEEAGLPEEYRGNLFVCDWGLQTVFRYVLRPRGGTFEVTSRTALVTKGDVADFRPFSVCVGDRGQSLYLVDWAYSGWLANGPKTGRLYRLTHQDSRPYLRPPLFPPLAKIQSPIPARLEPGKFGALPDDEPANNPLWIKTLDHPALSWRLYAQRGLVLHSGKRALGPLVARLRKTTPVRGRLHAIWALDSLDEPEGRAAVREALADPEPSVRLEAVRCAGIGRDQKALPAMRNLLKDGNAPVRREAAIALGKLGDQAAAPALMAALGDPDTFAAWSIRHAIRSLGAWDADALRAALLDPKRQDDALKLCDEAWAAPVVEALNRALPEAGQAGTRAKVVATLAGLYRKYPKWSGQWFGTNPLAGAFPQKTEPWDAAAMARIQDGLTAALKDASPAVRLQAIAGLLPVGRPAAPPLRALLTTETDPRNLAAVAQGLGVLGDFVSAPALGAIALDATRPEPVRVAALDALGNLRGPQALTARITIVYDPKAPAALVSRALPSLGREKIIPPNDMAGFLDHADPSVRAAALRALTEASSIPQARPPRQTPKPALKKARVPDQASKNALPAEVSQAVLAKLDDPQPEVKKAAIQAVAAIGLRDAVPRLLAAALNESTRVEATQALAELGDARALPVYLSALSDRSPEVRKAGERALMEIRSAVGPDLEVAARTGKFDGPAADALERVLTRYARVSDWKVIGPFARTTGRIFLGEPSIDFNRNYSGAEGRPITWAPRQADPASGRVALDDFKAGAGDRGGFGYDTNGSPDLCAFGFAEVESAADRDAFLLVGSSGSVTVTVNEREVLAYDNFAGREYRPDGDLARVALKKGKNRILVKSRQGVGVWSFGVRVSTPEPVVVSRKTKPAGPEALRAFALSHEGDPKNGEALFFDPKGIGCVKCHAAGGQGSANFGPDLTGLALKYDKAEIIRSVVEPSNRIATGYQPVVLATRDGKVVTGLVRSETVAGVEIVDSEARTTRIPVAEIEERKVGSVSVMPAGVTDALTVVEFADLISYLQTLKTVLPSPAAPPAAH